MLLSKIAAIESNSIPQFVITAFELLKEITLSGTMTFVKHISWGISLIEKLNSSFFFPQTLFRSKTLFCFSIVYKNDPLISIAEFFYSKVVFVFWLFVGS